MERENKARVRTELMRIENKDVNFDSSSVIMILRQSLHLLASLHLQN